MFDEWIRKREIRKLARQLNLCPIHLEKLYVAKLGHGWEADEWQCKSCDIQQQSAIERLNALRENRLKDLISDYSIQGLLK